MGESSSKLRTRLAAIVGAEHVQTVPASSPYNHDATLSAGARGRAQLVLRPSCSEEVAEAVAILYELEVPIVPRGGGTGLAGGAVPGAGSVVLSLERMRAVREFEPRLWRMHVEAGLTTAHVRRLARENGLMFPPDPGAAEQSQIGGNVATNAGGPHAFAHGPTREWVTGIEAVLAGGEIVEVGGAGRKDVGGYDLRSLMIGSEGTLGVITAVRLRLIPAPQRTLSLAVFLPDRGAGCEAILHLLSVGGTPAALDFIDGATLRIAGGGYPGSLPPGTKFMLLIDLEGSGAEVRVQHELVIEAMGTEALAIEHPPAKPLWRWRDGIGLAVTAARGGKLGEDVAVPVERLSELLTTFKAICDFHDLFCCAWGHGGDGNVHANVLLDPAVRKERAAAGAVTRDLMDAVVALGGAISGEHGIGLIKRGQLSKQWGPGAIAMHRAVKDAFDPDGLFNPGKKAP